MQLKDLNVRIRAKCNYNTELLNLPPAPRPYSKTDLHDELDSLRMIIGFGAMIVISLAVVALLFVALETPKQSLISLLIGIPVTLYFVFYYKRMKRTVDKLHDAICNWQQNTAVISGIKKLRYSLWGDLTNDEAERYGIRFRHQVGNRTYNVEQVISKLVIARKHVPTKVIDPFERYNGEVELKEGDEVSILYHPTNPEIAIIFPGPLKNYFYHPKILG